MAYEIKFAESVKGQLKVFTSRERSKVLAAIEAQLVHEPFISGEEVEAMRTIEISTASKPLAEYAREIGEEMIVLTDKDRPIAAIVSLENVDRESLSLGTNPKFLEIIRRAEEEFKAGKTLSLEEMKRAVLDDDEEE